MKHIQDLVKPLRELTDSKHYDGGQRLAMMQAVSLVLGKLQTRDKNQQGEHIPCLFRL